MDGLVALLLSGAGLFKCVFVESFVPDLGPAPSHFARAATAMSDTANTGKTNLFLFINVDLDILTKKLCHPGSITENTDLCKNRSNIHGFYRLL